MSASRLWEIFQFEYSRAEHAVALGERRDDLGGERPNLAHRAHCVQRLDTDDRWRRQRTRLSVSSTLSPPSATGYGCSITPSMPCLGWRRARRSVCGMRGRRGREQCGRVGSGNGRKHRQCLSSRAVILRLSTPSQLRIHFPRLSDRVFRPTYPSGNLHCKSRWPRSEPELSESRSMPGRTVQVDCGLRLRRRHPFLEGATSRILTHPGHLKNALIADHVTSKACGHRTTRVDHIGRGGSCQGRSSS